MNDVVGTVLHGVERVQQALAPGVAEALAGAPLPPDELGLYALIAEHAPARPSALAAAEGVSPSSMTATLRRLESRGHLRRLPDPADRRAVLVELSEAGQEVLAASKARLRAYADQVEAALGEQRDATRAALARLEQALLAARGVPSEPAEPAPAASLLPYDGPALSEAQAQEAQAFIRWLRFRDNGA